MKVGLGFIASIMNSEVVVLTRLNNGEIHVLGDKDRGVEMGDNVEASSGKAVNDNNGAVLSFVYDTPTAQIYSVDVDAITGVSVNVEPEP